MEDKTSQLREKLDAINVELGIYRGIAGLAVKKGDTGEMLNRLMSFVLKALKSKGGTVYIFDEKSSGLTFEVVKGPLAKKLTGVKIRADRGVAGRVVSTAKPYISNNLKTDKVWLGIKAGGAFRNMMAVPLIIKRKVIGVIQVFDKTGGFSKTDLKLLTSIANHFSVVMHNTNLFAELDGRVRQFSTLHEVGNLLISTLDQRTVRHRAMEAITRLMRAETGSLLMVDEEAKELYFEVALGEKGKKLKEIRLDIGEGIAGWVAKHGKPAIIHDVTRDKRFQGRVDKHSAFQTKNMICVPVKIKGRVIGVLQAINRLNNETFTEEDMTLFELFSNQVAIALDNARLYEEIKETFYATSEALAEAIEKRDPYTGGHTKRVLEYTLAIAKHMGLKSEFVELLKLSAVLHDIGKIGIEDSILRKGAPLDQDEASSMRQHPRLGVDILKHVPQLKEVIPGMLYHHERIDGHGYPTGTGNGQIPLIARIIAVADTYDAMTTTRPYRAGLPAEAALKELKKHSGTQFDPRVVDAFLKAFEKGDISDVCGHYGSSCPPPVKKE